MIEFNFVPFHLVAGEIAPNVARHYREMTDGDDYGPPNIDWDTYIQASVNGQCMTVTARDNGKLIGYSVYVIGNNPRYKHIIEADSNGIFLEKEYRGKINFFKEADKFLKKIAHETNYTLSDERVGKMLERNGYKSSYKIWSIKY
jgi:hypothetical protein